VRKPGILRLIEALVRRGFEGSSQAALGLQSRHAGTFLFSTLRRQSETFW
jgi:hypothetical protein